MTILLWNIVQKNFTSAVIYETYFDIYEKCTILLNVYLNVLRDKER